MTDRAAFEAWYGGVLPPRFKESGKYCLDLVESMWCAWQEAVRQEREAILATLEDLEEPRWWGYENPHNFEDGKRAAMAAVRSRSPGESALRRMHEIDVEMGEEP